MRLAFFTPWPPVRSGIADYTRDVVAGLGAHHEIEIFVASPAERETGAPGGAALRDAHDFPWRHARSPFDLIVHQLGNARCHDYMWPYVFRYPGLVVLHDAHLHHARAWSLLRRRRSADYRIELAFNHPDLPPSTADLAIHGFGGPIYYFWPMLRTVMAAARRVAVHNAALARDLAGEYPGVPVDAISMGVPGPVPGAGEVASIRHRHGIADDAVVLSAFGGVTPEKRIGPLLAAAAIARRYQPSLRIMLVGPTAEHFDGLAAARQVGVADIVTLTGHVADAELPAYLGASDIVSCLRFPTARETSASWLRALAAGRSTIITTLAQQADVPTLDPRSNVVVHGSATLERLQPVAVGVDPLDETHSLTLALKRLATDGLLRAGLGAAARQYWQRHHTVDRMLADYERVIHAAAGQPVRPATLPPHVRPDGREHARALAASVGVSLPADLE